MISASCQPATGGHKANILPRKHILPLAKKIAYLMKCTPATKCMHAKGKEPCESACFCLGSAASQAPVTASLLLHSFFSQLTNIGRLRLDGPESSCS